MPFLWNTPFLKYACRKFVLHEEKADSSALLQLLEYLNNINEEFEPQFAYLWFHKVQHMLDNALLIPNFVNLQLRKFPTRYPHYLAIYLKGRNFLRELIFANFFTDISRELIYTNWALLRILRELIFAN